jgi:hypothetical protein
MAKRTHIKAYFKKEYQNEQEIIEDIEFMKYNTKFDWIMATRKETKKFPFMFMLDVDIFKRENLGLSRNNDTIIKLK